MRLVRRLRVAAALTVLVLAVEVAGGLAAHSLALLSDAAHVVTDIAALLVAWYAAAQHDRPAHKHKTFGYHRAGILAALGNALALILIVAFIVDQAVQRLRSPEQVSPAVMAAAALVGIAVNLSIALALRPDAERDLNARAALLHVASDLAASAAVVVGAVVIALTGRDAVDPSLSLLIAVLVAVAAWRVLVETVNILLESVPRGVDLDDVVRDMRGVQGVEDLHDLHVWSLDSAHTALSAHVTVVTDDLRACAEIVARLEGLLQERHGVSHVTLQLVCTQCGPRPPLYCAIEDGTSEARPAEAATTR